MSYKTMKMGMQGQKGLLKEIVQSFKKLLIFFLILKSLLYFFGYF